MPKKPKLMFQICQNDKRGLLFIKDYFKKC